MPRLERLSLPTRKRNGAGHGLTFCAQKFACRTAGRCRASLLLSHQASSAMPTTDELAARLGDLEDRVSALEDRLMQETLRPVRQLAEEDNRWPDSYSGLVDLMEREGVPKRTRGGQVKEKRSRQTTYVSMFDLQEKT